MYRTGDYGRIINGMLYYEGRADSQIKVRGHRIDLTEINAVLDQLDQVSKGICLCYKPGEAEQVSFVLILISISICPFVHSPVNESIICAASFSLAWHVDDTLNNICIDCHFFVGGG